MSLPVTVPFTFGNATTTQSLSSLDTNFTTITNSVNGLTNGASQINVASITATGTANNSTFLRGDGAWATVTGGGTDATYANLTVTQNLIPPSSFLRNRIINGNMYVAQRGTSATVTAGTTVPTASTGYPCVDRWFVYSTGANVTAAQVAGATNNKNLLQVTGAASVTAVGIGQRIEQLNSYDLAGQTCTLSVNIANNLLTTVTWTASYATTVDTFGTIGTPTKTQIATGTFTVTSTLTQYTANIAVPAAATTGIEILFTVGAQISGTWQIGNAQLEVGTVATPFERRQYGQELMLCQRYYEINVYSLLSMTNGGYTNSYSSQHFYKVTKRTTPTLTIYSLTSQTGTAGSASLSSGGTNTTVAVSSINNDFYGSALIVTGTSTYGIAQYSYTASAEL
jgi:hypothetical protein